MKSSRFASRAWLIFPPQPSWSWSSARKTWSSATIAARQIFSEATSIPRSRKRFVLFRSDRHGFPPLIAEHTAPTGVHRHLDNGEGVFRAFQLSLGEVNAFDRAGFWRMTDLTLDAAARGQTLDDITRDLEQFRHLGFWSDGRRVTPPIIGADLDEIPRVIPGNGLRIFPWSPGHKASVALTLTPRPVPNPDLTKRQVHSG